MEPCIKIKISLLRVRDTRDGEDRYHSGGFGLAKEPAESNLSTCKLMSRAAAWPNLKTLKTFRPRFKCCGLRRRTCCFRTGLCIYALAWL
jgi:hypothetical protein